MLGDIGGLVNPFFTGDKGMVARCTTEPDGGIVPRLHLAYLQLLRGQAKIRRFSGTPRLVGIAFAKGSTHPRGADIGSDVQAPTTYRSNPSEHLHPREG